MYIEFPIDDEITVTNTTIKLTTQIRGAINGSTKEQIDARCITITKSLLGDEQKWAYSNFSWGSDKLTFSVTATTRIPTSLNDNLEDKAEAASTDDTKISIQNLDPSIPSWDIRKAERDIRNNIIKLANEEALGVGGKVTRIVFVDNVQSRNVASNFKATAFYDAAGSAPELGHSEKIFLKAIVRIKIETNNN